MSASPDPRLGRYEFDSSLLGNRRSLWVQTPRPGHRPPGLLLFLDGEHYLRDLGAVDVVQELRAAGAIPDLLSVYVSHIDYPTRWRESFCNLDFPRALADELLPWLRAEFDIAKEAPAVLVGLSLTGLAAAHAGLQRPGAFEAVACQSGSFWWEDGAFIHEVGQARASDVTFHLSVGSQETDEDVDHGDGLLQRESQLTANRRLRDSLRERGFACTYREFDGGHDAASFRRDLPDCLRSLG